jgi:hypothetical protein
MGDLKKIRFPVIGFSAISCMYAWRATVTNTRTMLVICLSVSSLCVPGRADRIAYSITKVATLGTPLPQGGGFHINDFEAGGINNRGDMLFATDLGTANDSSTTFGEGVFLLRAGQTSTLAGSNAPAPGGGIFDVLLMGQSQLNDPGDAAFAFTLKPFDFNASPFGLNAGVYRYSSQTGKVTAVVTPYVTPAPGGGTFAGAGFNVSLNNRGDLAFTGIAPTNTGLGLGVYKADARNQIAAVARPGDPAPPSGTFDSAGNSVFINQVGDVAFVAHLTGEEAGRSGLYLKDGPTGVIRSIAHAGDSAPRCGTFRSAYSPVLNDAGDLLFHGDLTASPDFGNVQGVYLYSKGKIVALACPGDSMPGGGNFKTAANYPNVLHLNNVGEAVFGASLDTAEPETGVWVASKGSLHLVARSGTVVPGVGTISQVTSGAEFTTSTTLPNTEVANNDRGQVMFAATLTDGIGVLLLATPNGK